MREHSLLASQLFYPSIKQGQEIITVENMPGCGGGGRRGRHLSSNFTVPERVHKIKQPAAVLTFLQQACEGLSKEDCSPITLQLSDFSHPLLGTLGNGKKDEYKYFILPFCTSRGFPEE